MPFLLLGALIVGALVASEAGYWLGRMAGPRGESFDKQLGIVSGATFALVAFLIGFAFAGAGSRFVDRLDLIAKEANALGTAYLRAGLMPEPSRGVLKNTLRDYTLHRVALLQTQGMDALLAGLAEVGSQHDRMWQAGVEGTEGNPGLRLLVLPALNEVIDLHTTHLSAARRRIPLPILVALLATTAVALGVAAFGNGQIGKRFPTLNAVYGLLLATALWMTIDLDNPRFGLIRLGVEPLVETLSSMKH